MPKKSRIKREKAREIERKKHNIEGFQLPNDVNVADLSTKNKYIIKYCKDTQNVKRDRGSLTREMHKLRVNAKRGFLFQTAASIAKVKAILAGEGAYTVRNMEVPQGLRWDQGKSSEAITPVHLAALLNHLPVVQLLLKEGAQVDSQTVWGETALHVVVRRGLGRMAAELVNAGANVHLKDGNGNTPLSLGLAELLKVAIKEMKEERVAWLAAQGKSAEGGKEDGKAKDKQIKKESAKEESDSSESDSDSSDSDDSSSSDSKAATKQLTRAQKIKLAKKSKKKDKKTIAKGGLQLASKPEDKEDDLLSQILSWKSEKDWQKFEEEYTFYPPDVSPNVTHFHVKVINYYLRHKADLGQVTVDELKKDKRNFYVYGVMEVRKKPQYENPRVRKYERVSRHFLKESVIRRKLERAARKKEEANGNGKSNETKNEKRKLDGGENQEQPKKIKIN